MLPGRSTTGCVLSGWSTSLCHLWSAGEECDRAVRSHLDNDRKSMSVCLTTVFSLPGICWEPSASVKELQRRSQAEPWRRWWGTRQSRWSWIAPGQKHRISRCWCSMSSVAGCTVATQQNSPRFDFQAGPLSIEFACYLHACLFSDNPVSLQSNTCLAL